MGTTISKGIKSFLSKKKTLITDDNITNSITENNKKTIDFINNETKFILIYAKITNSSVRHQED